MYKLSNYSLNNLNGVHPSLVACVKRAIEITEQDFRVIEGVRTPQRQQELYEQGRTKPGPIVTWTLKSRHMPYSDGYGHAVDLVPYPVDWNDTKKFDIIASAMFTAAKEIGIRIRWGNDWNMNGVLRESGESDAPHFELVKE